jgi:uroporphyrinogen-III synthase
MNETAASARPLDGRGVAITRAEPPDGPLARRLSRRGARVLHWQAIEIAPPRDPEPLHEAIEHLSRFDWVVFSSVHAVSAFEKAHTREESAASSRLRIGAVGRSTARALERAGLHVDLVPERSGALPLLEAFRESAPLAGQRVLLPSSSISRPELRDGLAALGAHVERVTAYETRTAALDIGRCREELAAGLVDAVVFTSPSAVASLVASFGAGDLAASLAGCRLVSIGPTTSGALAEAGLPLTAEARPSTLDGVVAATIEATSAGAPPA